jgi:hypothetical protein
MGDGGLSSSMLLMMLGVIGDSHHIQDYILCRGASTASNKISNVVDYMH